MTTRRGSCLCGGVRWSTDAELRPVIECHCPRCQKSTGNHMAATEVPTGSLNIDGQELRWYSPDDDPNVAYGFCSRCGSTLFWRSGPAGDSAATTSICAGSIDGPSGLRTTAIWHTDSAADHIRLDPTIPTHRREPG